MKEIVRMINDYKNDNVVLNMEELNDMVSEMDAVKTFEMGTRSNIDWCGNFVIINNAGGYDSVSDNDVYGLFDECVNECKLSDFVEYELQVKELNNWCNPMHSDFNEEFCREILCLTDRPSLDAITIERYNWDEFIIDGTDDTFFASDVVKYAFVEYYR